MKKILILGATGRTGIVLTEQALRAGYLVTVLVRNPGKLPISHSGLTVLEGNVLNRSDVVKAAVGQDYIVSTLGRDGKNFDVITKGTENIIESMKQNRVARFVCMSSMGAGSSSKSFGLLFQLILIAMGLRGSFKAKGEQEKMLESSGIQYCLVHAGSLTDESISSLDGINVLSSSELKRNFFKGPGKISRAQVSQFMLAELAQPKWFNKTVCIFG